MNTDDFKKMGFFITTGLKTILCDKAVMLTDFLLGTSLPFLVQFLIWTAVFHGVATIAGFSYENTIYYFAFAQIIGRLNNGYDVISHLSQQIYYGRLEAYLVKPIRYPLKRFAVYIGESLLYLIPLLLLLIIWLIQQPIHYSTIYLLGIMSLIFTSQILCYVIAMNIAIFAFWVIEADILLSTILILSTVLGGVLLPPEFWPEWLVPVMKYNPFQYMISAPCSFIVKPSISAWVEFMTGSWLYIGLLSASLWVGWRKGLNKYVCLGG